MKIEDAEKLWCPFSNNRNDACIHKNCMAWEPSITKDIDLESTNKRATLEEIASNTYTKLMYKKSVTSGKCTLLEKDK